MWAVESLHLLAVIWWLGRVLATSEQVDDKVVVLKADVLLRSRGETIATIPKGEILDIRNVDDGRVFVRYSGEERGTVEGWLKSSEVVPLSHAVDECNIEIERKPSAWSYSSRAGIYLAKGEYDKALADCDKAIRLDPKYGRAHYNRGMTCFHQGHYDQAISDLSEAIRLEPRSARNYVGRAAAWTLQRKYDQALSDCSEAIRIDAAFAMAYSGRAYVWHMKRNYAKAISDLDVAIRLEPTSATSHLSRGLERYATGAYSRAH